MLREDAGRFASQMGIQLFETSAKENINVEEMFRAITDLVLSSKKAQKEFLTQKVYVAMIYHQGTKENIIRDIIKH